ncbi:trypsin, alkaline B-like [Danaus plexippus]|uniref:trypsin, alkaline B-like n=1 Tax=Danaus plexippus TaxID=13037 RepID=UPI0013C4D9FD|nr:trypsin, alkaline B-like [Danaus plexippus]XP_032515460.1 trypsin, alkaline B-like isoform X2 [Danaus plexippus plexippus]
MRVLILLAVLGAACAAPRKSNRIVGGQNTNIERYPFMSGMLENSFWGIRQMCGGTLITNRAVVSAAHCYSGLSPSALRVRLGSTYASSGGQVQVVSRIIMHPQYNSRLIINDVAVIRLQNSVSMSNQIQVARIAGPQYNLPDNTRLDVIGWGVTRYQGRPSEVLQHVSVNVINQRICVERYAQLQSLPGMGSWPRVTPEMMCAGILDVGGKDACQGDSGGPVVHSGNVLVGITSWGYECAHPTYPGVNVRVSSYANWISANAVN